MHRCQILSLLSFIVVYQAFAEKVIKLNRVKVGVSGQTLFRVAIHLSHDFSVFSFDIVG